MPNKSTILIVDGCVMTRELIGLLLRAKKHKVIYTNGTSEAIELIRLHKPSVVIHELDLHDASGSDMIRRARTLDCTPEPDFFVLTTVTDRARLLEIIELGVTQVLIKHQFSIKIFYSKVESLICRRRAYAAKAGPSATNPPTAETAPPAPQSQIQNQSGLRAPGQSLATEHATAATNTPGNAPATRENQTPAPEPIVLRTPEQKKALYLALKPVMSKAEALERAEGVAELKALSPTAARVISLTGSAEASLDSITKAIRNDHAITLKIIRVANSAAFTRGEPVSTLSDAVLRIGVQQIRQAVINLEIMENFSSDTADYIDHRLFWEHSIGVAA